MQPPGMVPQEQDRCKRITTSEYIVMMMNKRRELRMEKITINWKTRRKLIPVVNHEKQMVSQKI
jgi:hypothetical protein